VKDSLLAKLVEAFALWDAAVVGLHIGEYMPSVKAAYKTKFNESKTVLDNASLQSVVDAEKVKLQANIDAFKAAANTADQSPEILLQELINDAEAIYTAAVGGIDKGQFAPADKETFRQAIDSAIAAIPTATEVNITTLNSAIAVFQSSVIATDRTALRTSIQQAQSALTAAQSPEEYVSYPQSAVEALTSALNLAKDICDNHYTASQEKVDTANINLQTAIQAFNATVVNRQALKATLDNAKSLLTATPGDASGQRPQQAFDALSAAVASAQTVFDSQDAVQTSLDASNTALNQAVTTFNNAVIVVDFTALDAAITLGNHYKETTTLVGNAARACPQAVYDTFVAKLTEISTMGRTVTQAEANAKTTELNSYIDTLLTQLKSELVVLIAEAEGLYGVAVEGSEPGNYTEGSKATLLTAINKAITARDATEGVQSTFNTAAGALYNSIYLFKKKQITAIHQAGMDQLFVYAQDNILHIKNLERNDRIELFTLSGIRIYSTEAMTDTFKYPLNKGAYVVVVLSENGKYSSIVVNQ
jgi:hypothetical protein